MKRRYVRRKGGGKPRLPTQVWVNRLGATYGEGSDSFPTDNIVRSAILLDINDLDIQQPTAVAGDPWDTEKRTWSVVRIVGQIAFDVEFDETDVLPGYAPQVANGAAANANSVYFETKFSTTIFWCVRLIDVKVNASGGSVITYDGGWPVLEEEQEVPPVQQPSWFSRNNVLHTRLSNIVYTRRYNFDATDNDAYITYKQDDDTTPAQLMEIDMSVKRRFNTNQRLVLSWWTGGAPWWADETSLPAARLVGFLRILAKHN